MNIGSIIERIDNFNTMRNSDAKSQVKSRGEVKEQEVHPEPQKSEILSVIGKLNNSLESINEKVSFSYHEENKRIIIKVIDKETREVVREIPPKDIVKLSEHLKEYLGMLVDESR
jgi:flagellar protein FlaG